MWLKRMKPAKEEEEPKEKEEKKGRKVSEDEKEVEEELQQEVAKPISEPTRFFGKGSGRRSHYEVFEFDSNRYELVRVSRFGRIG